MKKKDLVILILFAIIGIVAFFYDLSIIKFIEIHRNVYLNYFFFSINFLNNVFIVFFFLAVLLLWSKRKRWVPALIGSTLFSVIIAFIIKNIIKRPRPFTQGISMLISMDKIINYISWDFSFPSFQAMLIFATVPIVNKEFKKFKYYWFAFAVLAAFSRLYLGVHYLSDIIVGSVIGYIIGWTMVRLEEKYKLGHTIDKKIDSKLFGMKK